MKHLRFICAILIAILLLMPFSAFANAENVNSFADKTTFEFEISPVDANDNPGNVLVKVFCTTDAKQLITTFGTTLVVNTEHFDLVSKSGEVITDNYKKEATSLGSNFAFSASKIGTKKQVFGGMKGLSIASFNSDTKNIYIFMCGMTISGIKLQGKSELARFYLKSKTDKVPASSLRAMADSEGGKECPSKAVYCGEISSTTEGGAVVKDIKLSVDSELIDKSVPEESTTKQQAESTSQSATSSLETTTSSASDSGDVSTEELTDEKIDKMSETQLEQAINDIVQSDKKLNLPEKVKSSKAYKNYEKALQNAEKVLADNNSTKSQKAQALKDLVKAKNELEKEFPEVFDNSSENLGGSTSPLIYIAAAVGIAAIVIVLIIILKKRKK